MLGGAYIEHPFSILSASDHLPMKQGGKQWEEGLEDGGEMVWRGTDKMAERGIWHGI